jgi:hypothetical protein
MSPSVVNLPPDLDSRFVSLKKKLVAPENREKVTASWKRLLKALEVETEVIAEQGSKYVPQIDWQDIVDNDYQLPQDASSNFKQKGVIMINGVISEKQIDIWFQELVDFCKQNPETAGYTFPNPASWYNVFWSKPQVEARSHPNIQKLMKLMSRQFYVNDSNTLIDLNSQIVYGDRIRIRNPGTKAKLSLHLDSSSIERWEDDNFRKVYQEIFDGNWEDWDPFKLDARAYANENLYHDYSVARDTICSSFRTLQGWLALSDNKTGEGTLKVLPNIKTTMAYLMLRPLFWKDPESGNIDDYEMDLTTSKFPGATPSTGQLFVKDEFFYHLQQNRSSVGIPDVRKGAFVFWHCDLPHEVDKEHNGPDHSSVFYYGQTPLSLVNINSLLDTRKSFLENVSPEDYRTQLSEEVKKNEFQGADVKNIQNDEGFRSMGLKPFDVDEPNLTEGQRQIRILANAALESNHFVYQQHIYSQNI